jgi:uncharacterized protein
MKSGLPSPADAEAVLRRYYRPGTRLFEILHRHAEQVADKACRLAQDHPELAVDLGFLREAAILHDIGIFQTNTPQLDCHGTHPYVCHGVLGRTLLEALGLPRHALVCERHVGAGLSLEEIRTRGLPLPLRDMRPVSIEEQLIGYADKFFSKANGAGTAKPPEVILRILRRYGQRQAANFAEWAWRFEGLRLSLEKP